MSETPRHFKAAAADFSPEEALSPYKTTISRNLTPRERLARSAAMRLRLRNPQAIHDAKLFPKP